MNIVVARLLALDVWRGANFGSLYRALEKLDSRAVESGHSNSLMVSYEGRWWGSHALFELPLRPAHIPEFWRETLLSVHVTGINLIEGYYALAYVVDVSPDDMSSLTKDAHEFTQQADQLVDKVLLDLQGERVVCPPNAVNAARLPSVLYLRPDKTYDFSDLKTLKNTAWKIVEEGLPPWLRHLCHTGFDSLFLENAILLPYAGLAWPDRNLTAIDFVAVEDRNERHERKLVVSRTIYDLLIYVASSQVLAHQRQLLKNSTFYARSVERYLQELKANSSPGEKELLKLYESRFLVDRQAAIEQRLEAQRAKKELDRLLEWNHISRLPWFEQVGRAFALATNPHRPLSMSFSSALRAMDSLHRELEEAADRVLSRETALADHLRDATTAEAARANLALQASIRKLTSATVFIAIVALLIALLSVFLPEEVKKWPAQQIVQGFTALTDSPSRYPHAAYVITILLVAGLCVVAWYRFWKWAWQKSKKGRLYVHGLIRLLK